MKKSFLAFVVTFAMMLSLVPQVHASTDAVVGAAAQIERNGVTTVYNTLDEAIKDVKDNDVVEVLKDCETKGLNVTKDFAVKGVGETTPTIHFTEDGIALWGKNLSFENVNLDMDNVVSTPYHAEWDWMTMSVGVNSQLSFKDCSIVLDGHNRVHPKPYQKYTGIYVSENADVYFDHCDLSIKNFQGGAVVKDAGRASNLVFKNQSTFTATNNYSGFVNTFNVKATNSKIDVVGNRGNGSNGSNYYLDHATVDFSNNGSHGLSATVVKAKDSTIKANNNKCAGLLAVTTFDVRNSQIEVMNNGYTKNNEYPGVSLKSIKNGLVDKDSTLNIQKNANNGLRIFKSSQVTFEEGADLTVMNNNSCKTTGGNGLGGGVRLVESSTLILPTDAKIYNNTAELAGDDIYVTSGSQITVGPTGKDWKLDGTPNTHDCTRFIDGWYDDSQNGDVDDKGTKQYNRWNAHVEDTQRAAKDFHVVKIDAGTLKGPIALKAAHGIAEEDIFETATIPFEKVDSTNGKGLAGAEFTVYTDEACKDIMAVLSSDENGRFGLKELPEGIYYLKETKSPQGYEPLKDIIVIEVSKDEENVTSEYVVKGQEVYHVNTHPVKVTVKNESDYVTVSKDQVIKISNDAIKVVEPETDHQGNQTNTPETGDTTSLTSYIVIAGVALLAMGGLMMSKKKHS